MKELDMEELIRAESVITGHDSLELLSEMKAFPVFIGTTNRDKSDDLFADMDWYICKESGVIQLKKLLPLDVVYSAYHSEAVGGLWQKHHVEFVDFCQCYSASDILEIGGSNGFIAQRFVSQNEDKNWTIVEPNPGFDGNEKIKVVKGFFDKNFLDDSINTIVHSHVIEHLYDPNEFLQNICDFLCEGQYQVFSIPNLKQYLISKFTNTINFEHTFFLTEELMDYLLSLYQFEILEKKYFGDHSIFYATRKNSKIKPIKLTNYYDEYKALYANFRQYYTNEVKRLNSLINNFEGKIYLFGAHVFSQYLLYIGLNTDKVELILDNSVSKTGQRLYGSDLLVELPSNVIKKEGIEPIAVILKAGQYQEEITTQLLNLSEKTIIWD